MKDKIVIVGAGLVGSTIGYAIMNWGLASEIVLIDIDQERAKGEAMDLGHGTAFVKPVRVKSGDYSDCRDARIVIITAGVNQKPDESRLNLVKRNTDIFLDIIPRITEHTDNAILLVVTNPVDILTYITFKISGFPARQIMGSGTVLDTSRFRYLLSKKCDINPQNIHAYIIGEHGDHEVAAWSLTNIAGIPFPGYCKICNGNCTEKDRQKIYKEVRESAYRVIEKKKATYYAIGLAVTRIVESIIRDENSILTVSSVLNGEYGLNNVALSLPHVIGINGIERVLPLELQEKEEKKFIDSAGILKKVISELNLHNI